MELLNPDEYESLTGITKVEYETHVLEGARAASLEQYPHGSPEATIEAIKIEGEGQDTSLVILFRIPARPDCLFGTRSPMWPVDPPEGDNTPEKDGAWGIVLGVGEYVDQGGLVVHESVRDGITWLP